MNGAFANYLDALHGEVRLDDRIAQLAGTPVVQRLRHVRLSNIDSTSMPGVANLSRYEHVLGVAYLASRIGLRRRINPSEHLALMAAALLHDWAITAFGHLVEEAFNYLSIDFDHERKLDALLHGNPDGDTLGAELQIIAGRQTGLRQWIRTVAEQGRQDELLDRVGQLIRGNGPLGRLICGEMDLDNIDNVYRMAFHMGLPVDRGLPARLAEAIVGTCADGSPVFNPAVAEDVEAWVVTRRAIYSRLMLARPDFSYKIMIIWATTKQIEAGLLTAGDWTLTDSDLITQLSASKAPGVADTVARWKAGEPWDISPLWWMRGERPSYADLAALSAELSDAISRTCFAYGIKDKRERRLRFRFGNNSSASFGSSSHLWLLGVGSPERRAFTRQETDAVISMVVRRFTPMQQPMPAEDPIASTQQACLL